MLSTQADTKLSIHAGIGAGALCAYRVGTPSRWEFFVSGEPLQQVAMAEGHAAFGEAVVSAAAWALVHGECAGCPCGNDGAMRLLNMRTHAELEPTLKLTSHEPSDRGAGSEDADGSRDIASPRHGDPSSDVDAQRLHDALFTRDLIELQRSEQSHGAFSGVHRTAYEAALEGYVHETARRSISVLDEVAERRTGVVVAFAKVVGLESAFEATVDGLDAVQHCLTTALECITKRGGLLRQFILDDKGVVIIWTFGLTLANFEDNARLGLLAARHLDEALAAQGLTVHVGITSGEAFCGLVGVPKRRCEYGVMGPSVNLAARLMCMCAEKDVRILCCDQLFAELHVVQRDRQFLFDPFEPVTVKGYSQPVVIYHPKPDRWLMDVKKKLEQFHFFGLLAPREQSKFLEAMVEQSFPGGTAIITEGDEGTTFYIIIEGTVRITQWQYGNELSSEQVVLVDKCSRGDSFGEVALISACKRTASVTATSDVVCMTIERDTFAALFGTMSEIISNKLDREAQNSAARSRSLPASERSLRRSATSRRAFSRSPFDDADERGIRGPSNSMAPQLVERSKGRETEARHLANRVESLLATGEPSLCLVSGEPGIGKSHLLRELRRCYGESDVRVVHAEAQRHDAEPLSVWLPLVRALIAAFLGVPVEQAQLAKAMHVLPAEFRGWAGRLSTLLDGRSLDAAPRHMPAECEMMVRLVNGLIGGRPQLILIDAAENLSSYAWSIAHGVLSSSPSVAVMIASRDMTTWCEDEKRLAEFHHLVEQCGGGGTQPTCRLTPKVTMTQLELLPLTDAGTRALLADLVDVAPDVLTGATVTKAHLRSGGIPGFLFEFCKPLVETGDDREGVNEAVIRSLEALPATVKEIVLAELDRLPVQQQHLIKIAAAIDGPFDREMLISIYPGPAVEVEEALRASSLQSYFVQLPRAGDTNLDDSERGSRDGSFKQLHSPNTSFNNGANTDPSIACMPIRADGSRRQYVLKHATTGQVVYDLMLQAQRQRLHKQIAEWFLRLFALSRESSRVAFDLVQRIAYHSARSGATEVAKRHLLAAGGFAVKRGLYREAEGHFTECISLFDGASCPNDATFVQAQVSLAEMYSRYSLEPPRGTSAVGLLKGLLVAHQSDPADPERMLVVAQVCHSLAWALMKHSLVESATAIEQNFERAVTLRRAANAPQLAAESLNGRGVFFHQRGINAQHEKLQKTELFQLARETIAESIALSAGDPRYAWSVELAQSLSSLGALQRDMASPCLSAGTCLAAYERYSATLSPYHPRAATALQCMWRAYEDMGSSLCALTVIAALSNILESLGTNTSMYQATLKEYNRLNKLRRPWHKPRNSRRSSANSSDVIASVGADRDVRMGGGSAEADGANRRPRSFQRRAIRASLEDLGRPAPGRTGSPTEIKESLSIDGRRGSVPALPTVFGQKSVPNLLSDDEPSVSAPPRPPSLQRSKSTIVYRDEPSGEGSRSNSPAVAVERLAAATAPTFRPSLKPAQRMEAFLRTPWCVELCQRCMRGEYVRDPQSLRTALCERYPEIGFYVGLTLEGDGTLSDRAEQLQSHVLTSMVLACELAASVHGDQPEAEIKWHVCRPLLALAEAAVPTAKALHSILVSLALRSLHRVALLVHDAGARVDELSTIEAAELIDAVSAYPELHIPSLESLEAEDSEQHHAVMSIVSCPLRFERFVFGETLTSGGDLTLLYEMLDVSGLLASQQTLIVHCLGDLAHQISAAMQVVSPKESAPDSASPRQARVHSSESDSDSFMSTHSTSAEHTPGFHDPASATALLALVAAAIEATHERSSGPDGDETDRGQASVSDVLSAPLPTPSREVSASGVPPPFSASSPPSFSASSPPFTTQHDATARYTSQARKAVGTYLETVANVLALSPRDSEALSSSCVLCIRICCMLRARADSLRHVRRALDLLSSSDLDVLLRELDVESPDRDRTILLLEVAAVVRECDEKASRNDFFENGIGATLTSPSNTSIIGRSPSFVRKGSALGNIGARSSSATHVPVVDEEVRVRALKDALSCMANLFRIGRGTMLSVYHSSADDDRADQPFVLFCGNVLRVVTTEGRRSTGEGDRMEQPRGRLSRTPSSLNLEGRIASGAYTSPPQPLKRPPSTCELLQAASFGVMRATAEYAHLAVEAPKNGNRLSDANGLHPDSDDLLLRLSGTIAAEMEAATTVTGPDPLPVLMVSAPGDAVASDELALVLSRALADLRILDLRGAVFPPNGRLLAQGVLDALEVRVPVAVGADNLNDARHWRETDCERAASMLLREVEAAAPASLTLLVTTRLTDVAAFIKRHRKMFAAQVRRVVLLGNVDVESLSSGARNEAADLHPDVASPNFKLDIAAANYVFHECQQLLVQLVIVTDAVTAAVPLPSFVYDELAAVGHPIAVRLRESQRASMQSLWHRANLPSGHNGRRGLMGDRAWFSRTFCGGADLTHVSEETNIWPFVCEFTVQDPLALLACHPATLEAFYDVTIKVVNDVEHMVIGESAERSGVRDCAKLRSFVLDGCRHAFAASFAHATSNSSDEIGRPGVRLLYSSSREGEVRAAQTT